MNYHQNIASIYQKIAKHINMTPLIYSEYFSNILNCRLYFKCENLQYTNAFKLRGALNKITNLEDKSKTLVTASAGNHGLAVSYVARLFAMKSIINLPKNTPDYKIEKIKNLQAEVVLTGNSWDEANEKAMLDARENNFVYIHPFSDDTIINGQATLAHELFLQKDDIDVIIASIGGGGLISGIAKYSKSYNPKVKIYGVETIGADSMYQSIMASQLITLSSISSIAESLGALRVTDLTYNYVKQNVDDLFTVGDDMAKRDLLRILQEEKLLVEPASSCSLSALMDKKINNISDKNVVVVLCGGNIPFSKVVEYQHN